VVALKAINAEFGVQYAVVATRYFDVDAVLDWAEDHLG
jgi:hypothetical protein